MKIIIIILLLVLINYVLKYYYKRKKIKEMGDLTGIYSHTKSPNGMLFSVQFKDEDNNLKFRKGTINDIIILQKYKYIYE